MLLNVSFVFAQPELYAKIKVLFLNRLTNAPESAPIRFINVVTDKVYEFTTKTDGTYELTLPKAKKYKVQTLFLGEYLQYKNIVDIPTTEGPLTIKYILYKPVFIYESAYILKVYFDVNKFVLKPSSKSALDGLLVKFREDPTMNIEIAGYTDSQGSFALNMRLSQRRADAVKNYLIKHGVAKYRIVAKGYGDTQPIGDNRTDAGRQKNRRTEVTTIGM